MSFYLKNSKIKSKSHYWSGPKDRKGYPSASADTSNGDATNESYWRGNKPEYNTSAYGTTSSTGDPITAPPVYLGVYIMRTA